MSKLDIRSRVGGPRRRHCIMYFKVPKERPGQVAGTIELGGVCAGTDLHICDRATGQ